MAKLTGTNPDQVPTNADLGDMAYQSKDNVSLGGGKVTGDITVQNNKKIYFGTDNDMNIVHGGANGSINNTTGNLSYNSDQHIFGDEYGTERMKITSSGEVQVTSGLLELDGNDIGGTQVTIADDAVASITPPRNGGFMMITCQGDAFYPNVAATGMIYYDVGLSLDTKKLDVFGTYTFGSSDLSVTTGDLTGTTGTDTHVTVSAMSGVIKVENRVGSAANFQITFL